MDREENQKEVEEILDGLMQRVYEGMAGEGSSLEACEIPPGYITGSRNYLVDAVTAFAEEMGLSVSTLAKYEKGQSGDFTTLVRRVLVVSWK